MPQQSKIITSRKQLESSLGLPATVATNAERDFALRVPVSYMQRMRFGDATDPLLRQVLPVAPEDQDSVGYSHNPLREVQQTPGLLHKYRHRALIITTASCPVHCRYCFRRHFSYSTEPDLNKAVTAIEEDSNIHEVILSGGDPMTLSNQRLTLLLDRLYSIGHLRRLRIHSRVPVVQPERIDRALLAVLSRWQKKPCVLVIHCNHPQEIDHTVKECLQQLATAGITLLNQAVLLRGINDTFATQRRLSEQLFNARVLPYYLHLLDPVQGAAHFAVNELRAKRIIGALRASLPGYLVPRLAREVPGANSKLIVA
ncbi:MAG: EF-P beta-lysylation protein EpmB [Candidatus Porifericomitaceae bacterium WSBS_2022_MAG_OTU9]